MELAPIERDLGKKREELTKKEIFDYVYKHLEQQGSRSVKDFKCVYRHNGLMCAAGPLLTDEEAYKWEGAIFCNIDILSEEMNEFVYCLQRRHDLATSFSAMMNNLKAFGDSLEQERISEASKVD